MITFVGKAVPIASYTPGKRVSVKVIWKNSRFVGKRNGEYFEIDGWNDISKAKWIYALPTNTYFTEWHRRPYIYQSDPDAVKMTLRFWGKYRSGMTIYGKIIDNIFYESSI